MTARQSDTPATQRPDKTPSQALKDDWPAKHNELGPFITAKGEMRSGLSPSQQAKAQEILKGYGF